MKKIIILLLLFMNFTTIDASQNTPTYKIIANSNSEQDIQEMYEIKEQLLEDFKEWAKGVDNHYQVLADHQSVYHAEFSNGEYRIVLGEGKGKELSGKLQTSYCTSSQDIEKKSWLAELFS